MLTLFLLFFNYISSPKGYPTVKKTVFGILVPIAIQPARSIFYLNLIEQLIYSIIFACLKLYLQSERLPDCLQPQRLPNRKENYFGILVPIAIQPARSIFYLILIEHLFCFFFFAYLKLYLQS